MVSHRPGLSSIRHLTAEQIPPVSEVRAGFLHLRGDDRRDLVDLQASDNIGVDSLEGAFERAAVQDVGQFIDAEICEDPSEFDLEHVVDSIFDRVS
jgi:hypothetical protein